MLPGNGDLKIELLDYDPILSDDIIGETHIDLERRYFDEKWIGLPNYPIETRILRKSGTESSVGTIRLWVEVFNPLEKAPKSEDYQLNFISQIKHVSPHLSKGQSMMMSPPNKMTQSILFQKKEDSSKQQHSHIQKDDSRNNSRKNHAPLNSKSKLQSNDSDFGRKIWDISLMPPEELELRVVIWEVFDCPIDDPEGLTDIFVSCSMSSYKKGLTLKTDTHIRSEGYVKSTH